MPDTHDYPLAEVLGSGDLIHHARPAALFGSRIETRCGMEGNKTGRDGGAWCPECVALERAEVDTNDKSGPFRNDLRTQLVAAGTEAAEQWLTVRANRKMSDVNRRRLAGHVVNALWAEIERAVLEMAPYFGDEQRFAESATVLPERWRALIAERNAATACAEKTERASQLLVVGQNELDRQWAETDAATRAEFEAAMSELRERAEEAEALAASPRQLRAAFAAGWHSHSAAMNGALATVGWEARDEAAKHWARGFAGDAEAADAASASRTERKFVPPRPTSDMILPAWDDPITLAEFSLRANRSTVDAANPAWDGVARDVRLCASESASEPTKTEKP